MEVARGQPCVAPQALSLWTLPGGGAELLVWFYVRTRVLGEFGALKRCLHPGVEKSPRRFSDGCRAVREPHGKRLSSRLQGRGALGEGRLVLAGLGPRGWMLVDLAVGGRTSGAHNSDSVSPTCGRPSPSPASGTTDLTPGPSPAPLLSASRCWGMCECRPGPEPPKTAVGPPRIGRNRQHDSNGAAGFPGALTSASVLFLCVLKHLQWAGVVPRSARNGRRDFERYWKGPLSVADSGGCGRRRSRSASLPRPQRSGRQPLLRPGSRSPSHCSLVPLGSAVRRPASG